MGSGSLGNIKLGARLKGVRHSPEITKRISFNCLLILLGFASLTRSFTLPVHRGHQPRCSNPLFWELELCQGGPNILPPH